MQRYGKNDPYELVAVTPSSSFRHESLPSFAGCYRITAIDLWGNESGPSAVACRDNCPNLMLPNVFTPNRDGINEFFKEFGPPGVSEGCSRFVQRVEFTVFSRYGTEIYCQPASLEGPRWILWDGLTNQGSPVSAGAYYYQATVTFDVLDPALEVRDYRGWIQVIY